VKIPRQQAVRDLPRIRGEAGHQPEETCLTCNGAGELRMTQGFFQISRTCGHCQGTGKVITEPCATCRGAGKVDTESVLTVKGPARRRYPAPASS